MSRSWADIQAEMDGGVDRPATTVPEGEPDDAGLEIEPEARYYPGSRTPIPDELPPPPDEVEDQSVDPSWRRMGRDYIVGGKTVKLFAIGALAKALGRDATTIRSWEQKKWLPKPVLRGAEMGHGGHRRLYTTEQIERLVAAALECGLLVDVKKVRVLPGDTAFPELAKRIFEESA